MQQVVRARKYTRFSLNYYYYFFFKLCYSLTILTNIHTDGVNVGEVGHGRPHGGTGRPHVVEEEDRHGGEAKHAEPGHTQNVCEEHKLRTERWHDVTIIT